MDLVLLGSAAVVAAFVLRTALELRGEHAAALAAGAGARPRPLGPYELAYVAGGARRVADTALAVLAGAGHVRVARGGTVHRVHAPASGRDPVEEAVLGVLASRSGLPVTALRVETGRTLAMDALARRLAGAGLVLAPGAFERAARLAGRLRWAAVVVLAGEVLTLVTIVVQGVRRSAVAALAVLAATGVFALVAAGRQRRAARATVTGAGLESLEAARAGHPRGTAEEAYAVALYGLGAVRDPALQVELAAGDRGGG
ncbi:TIGR04222 domain-containing membrane protein [Actinomadura sp. ATCC 31491]|uniref:TIGR04222 domain-containing membrane protein n=1 Tax=Actinomadura luzonensis TaxID=2805427 RepID=A0ABT0FLG8_9ACTN|nr:TIGR04222 domain-containing membrane protein [Actinomadura luzonensis]MCK2213158.1 TIGR04222 domain-containing membrane protein [Actinomadura luzonensis]